MNVHDKARHILMHALALVLAGLIWGLVVPHTPFPRLALGAHIQLVSSGILFAVLATLLLTLSHAVSARSAAVMLWAVRLSWLMALSEVANAWWGTTQMLPLAAQQAGATGGAIWQEALVKLAHIGAGFALIVAWLLLIAGFMRKPAP